MVLQLFGSDDLNFGSQKVKWPTFQKVVNVFDILLLILLPDLYTSQNLGPDFKIGKSNSIPVTMALYIECAGACRSEAK